VTPEPTTPAPLAAYLPDAATGTAPGHGLLAGRRLLVVVGGQQTYGQTDPPTGIGRAISLLAAREGAAVAVAVADINHDAAQATVDRITAEGGTGHAVAGDASDPGDAGRILTAAANVLGGLDAMTLNTGIAAGLGLTPTTCADWDRVMAVNVRAHFLALQAAVTVLEPGGAITLTSSTAARVVTTTDIPAYTTSKAALEGLCAYAAKEYAPRRIRVNVVMAGLIDTSLGRLATQFLPSAPPPPSRSDGKAPHGRSPPRPSSCSPTPPLTSPPPPSPSTAACPPFSDAQHHSGRTAWDARCGTVQPRSWDENWNTFLLRARDVAMGQRRVAMSGMRRPAVPGSEHDQALDARRARPRGS